MISGIQQGFSKKNGKPYAMVTLEDLQGNLSMLCMNENYDKYKDLLVPGKALLVVGEVNNDEDRPKLFPQELMPLEDAPRKYTRQVHFRLNRAHLDEERFLALRQLLESHSGRIPVYFCIRYGGGELVYLEPHDRFFVTPSLTLQQTVDELFGEETYYAKADMSLPERQKKPWERARNGNGGGDE
jgi:DNA polymerase-3 subunit alpha